MPFFAKNGFYPSIKATVWAILPDRSVPYVLNMQAREEKWVELWAAIEQHWKYATVTQRNYTDRCTKHCKVEVGDMVSLSCKNIWIKHPSKKLDHGIYRPYPVIEQIGTHAYPFKLLQQAGSIYDTYHVLLHKPYKSDRCTVPVSLSPIKINCEEKYKLTEVP